MKDNFPQSNSLKRAKMRRSSPPSCNGSVFKTPGRAFSLILSDETTIADYVNNLPQLFKCHSNLLPFSPDVSHCVENEPFRRDRYSDVKSEGNLIIEPVDKSEKTQRSKEKGIFFPDATVMSSPGGPDFVADFYSPQRELDRHTGSIITASLFCNVEPRH